MAVVGIDLGTTYSAIAALDERGHPVTLPNRDGEMLTASAVLVEDNDAGANTLQNGPDVDEVTDSSVEWEFESERDTTYRLEFFVSDECDPSASGG